MEQTTAPIAEILDWRYDYRFTGSGPSERVDIDIALTLRKHDSTPIVAGASLFAAGDTTPAGLVDLGPGDYTIRLPIRHFQTPRWNPASSSGTQKRHLLNLKLTSVPEDRDEDPTIYALRGVTVGFRTIAAERTPEGGLRLQVNGSAVVPAIGDASELAASDDLRATLTAWRDSGTNLLRIPNTELATDDLYRLCDELGVLVWQNVEEADPATVRPLVRRLRPHPALAIWSGGDDVLPGVLAQESPDAVYIPAFD